jgi:hypothetical protein
MNAITEFLAGPYAWIARCVAIAALALGLFGFGFVKGMRHDQHKLDELIGRQAVETVRIARGRDHVTTVVETKYLPQVVRQQVVTETIIKEVPVYVPADAPDLPAGFRELHDAAAQGRLPDPSRIRDGSAVSAQDVASVVTENYGVCRADQLKLQELQEWVREQAKVK